MEICSHNHDEIVYDSHYCPLCLANDEIEMIKTTVEDLEKEVEKFQEEAEYYRDIVEEHCVEYLI